MAATQIKEVRPPHEAVMDVMLANPWWTLKQLSAATGYSVSWLSQMIRSDCFRAEFDKRREGIEVNVLLPIQERLEALAHVAIDGMEEMLTKGVLDADTRIDAFDRVMHRTGYAPASAKTATQPQGSAIQQNNYFLVKPDELRGLRETIINGEAERVAVPALPEPPAEHNS